MKQVIVVKQGAKAAGVVVVKQGAKAAGVVVVKAGPKLGVIAAGVPGRRGPQGIQGIQGEQGEQGEQGIQGVQGIQGPQGDQGPQGIQGIQGPAGADSTVPGPAGPTGPQGEPGPAGSGGDGGGFGSRGIAWVCPTPQQTAPNSLGVVVSGTGTPSAGGIAATNVFTSTRRVSRGATTASTSAVAGFRDVSTTYYLGGPSNPFGGFSFYTKFGPSTGAASNATRRFFVGFSSLSGSTTASDVNPSTNRPDALGVCADAADVNFQIVHRTGSGLATKIDTGIPKAYADSTEMFAVRIVATPTPSASAVVRLTRMSDGLSFESTITSNLPAATTILGWRIETSVGGTSSVVGIAIGDIYIESY